MKRDWAEFWELVGGVALLSGFLVYSVLMRDKVNVSVAGRNGPAPAQLGSPAVVPPTLIRTPQPRP